MPEHAEIYPPCPKRSPTQPTKILQTNLASNPTLSLPETIKTRLPSVHFTPEDSTPSIPTPAKLSESSALWGLLGTFSAVIAEGRYSIPEQNVIVDVHSATLFPMSALLAKIEGKGVWDAEVKGRMLYLDLGGIREPYRSLASNIYKTKDNRFFHLHGSLNTTNTLHMLSLPQHRPDLTTANSIKEIYRTAVAEHTAARLDTEANDFWRQPGTICYTQE
ncbi:hypothetical protein N7532_002290 [Penicillium argentinense]|uniref:Uncharacterized protein n=1 Tax=Penicillium argentinense TaxID=1131581 RepID=A0A9W9G051_9EURO|nr:uncharacterized protein N7532_002290 [Penicillium argentinense]KAJ5109645.1 hypothetical protein N7532_002290 [Penicillium argentinense]